MVPHPASSIVPILEHESTLTSELIQWELSELMTVSALMLGFSLPFGGSADRGDIQNANRENKGF